MDSQLRQPGFARDQGEAKWASGGRVGGRSLPPLLNRSVPPSQLPQPGFARAASHAPLPQPREVCKEQLLPPLPRPAVSAPITVWREPPSLRSVPPGASLPDKAAVTVGGAVDARHRSRSQRSLSQRLEPLEAPPKAGPAQVAASHSHQHNPKACGTASRKRSLGKRLEPLGPPAKNAEALAEANNRNMACPPAVPTDTRQTSRHRSSSRKAFPESFVADVDQNPELAPGRRSSRGRQHSREIHLGMDVQSGLDNPRDCLQAMQVGTVNEGDQPADASALPKLPKVACNVPPIVDSKQLFAKISAEFEHGPDANKVLHDMEVASTVPSSADVERNAPNVSMMSVQQDSASRDCVDDDSKQCSSTAAEGASDRVASSQVEIQPCLDGAATKQSPGPPCDCELVSKREELKAPASCANVEAQAACALTAPRASEPASTVFHDRECKQRWTTPAADATHETLTSQASAHTFMQVEQKIDSLHEKEPVPLPSSADVSVQPANAASSPGPADFCSSLQILPTPTAEVANQAATNEVPVEALFQGEAVRKKSPSSSAHEPPAICETELTAPVSSDHVDALPPNTDPATDLIHVTNEQGSSTALGGKVHEGAENGVALEVLVQGAAASRKPCAPEAHNPIVRGETESATAERQDMKQIGEGPCATPRATESLGVVTNDSKQGDDLSADMKKEPVVADEEAFYEEHRAALLDAIRNGGKLQRRGEGGVGLLNQGATCYMNSLLQALFHTLEFRLVLYRFKYDTSIHGEATRSIPLQLQRLFAELQLSSSSAISTKALTVACGFTAMQAREQHDVQELCRVLFDALERSASGISAEIADLYAGRVTHYVRSREEVNGKIYQSRREEKFLDLQVPIQGCRELQDALGRLVEPEVLDGDNRWFCDELGEKVDALKGVEFSHLPRIFCLQLLRFVFDCATMRRVKLNETLSIPLELDLGLLLVGPESHSRYELAAVCLHRGTAHGGHYHALACEAHTGRWLDANDSNVRILGPDEMKHLFSGKSVTQDVEVSDDGRPTALLSPDAYFLIYRAVGLQAPHVQDVDVPEPHRCEILGENRRLGDLQQAYEIHRSLVHVTIFAPTAAELSLRRHAARQLGNLAEGEASIVEPAHDPISIEVTIPGSKSISHLVDKARAAFTKEAKSDDASWAWATEFENQDVVQARLRQYDYMSGDAREPLEGHALVSDVFGRASGFSQPSLLLELSPAGMQFEPWAQQHTRTVICRWNEATGRPSLATGDVLAIPLPPASSVSEPAASDTGRAPEPMRAAQRPSPLVGSLRAAVAAMWGLELQSTLALVPLSGAHAGEVLVDDSRTLAECGVTAHDVLCAEVVVSDTIQAALLYERMRNTVHLSFNHPDRPEEAESFKISISKSGTLEELKLRIADILGLSHEELHLRRADRTPQLKDETKTLRQVGLADSESVFVGHGAPCAADECMIQVVLYSSEKGSHKTQEVFTHAARGGVSVKNLREALAPRLLDWAKRVADSDASAAPFTPEGFTWKRLRLRDGQVGKHFAILRDERTLRSALLGFGDGRVVAVQVLDVEEELTPDDLILAVRPWRVREGRLHAPTEFIFNKTKSLQDLLASLTERYRGLLQSKDGSAAAAEVEASPLEQESQPEQDRLELLALPSTGAPITIKRLTALKWAESKLNQDDLDVLMTPLSEFRDIRDGATLVVRSKFGAAMAPAPSPKAKAVPKASARRPPAPSSGVARKERSLVIEVVCPERLPQPVDEERGLVIEVAHQEGLLHPGGEANSMISA